MDEGPFRMPRPAGRGADSQPPEEPKAAIEEPKPVHRPIAHRTPHLADEKKSRKTLFVSIAIAVVVILGGLGGWALITSKSNGAVAIDTSKYQAVFLSNGQSYFGKLHPLSDEYLRLTDVYYLQTQQADADSKNTQTTTDQNNVQLIKLGDELHGPQDEMVISKDQILFYENLKPDGKVSQSIEKFKKS